MNKKSKRNKQKEVEVNSKSKKENIFVRSKKRKESLEKQVIERIIKLPNNEFLLEYSKAEARYNYNKNILKYFLPPVVLALGTSILLFLYKIIKMFILNDKIQGNDREVVLNLVILIMVIGIILILLIFYIVMKVLNNIQLREKEYLVYKNYYEKGKK